MMTFIEKYKEALWISGIDFGSEVNQQTEFFRRIDFKIDFKKCTNISFFLFFVGIKIDFKKRTSFFLFFVSISFSRKVYSMVS